MVAVHEFGAAKKVIPSRPFMRAAIQAHSGEWRGAFARLAKRAFGGEGDARKQIESMGSHPEWSEVIRHRRGRASPIPTQAASVPRDTIAIPVADKAGAA